MRILEEVFFCLIDVFFKIGRQHEQLEFANSRLRNKIPLFSPSQVPYIR